MFVPHHPHPITHAPSPTPHHLSDLTRQARATPRHGAAACPQLSGAIRVYPLGGPRGLGQGTYEPGYEKAPLPSSLLLSSLPPPPSSSSLQPTSPHPISPRLTPTPQDAMPYSYRSGDSPPASHNALLELSGGEFGGDDAASMSRMESAGGSSGSSERSSRRRSKRPSKSKSKKSRRQEAPGDQI